MLTEEQKVEIRRHLNYGVHGDQVVSTGFFYSREFAEVERKLNHLSVEEERTLLGGEVAGYPIYPKFDVPCSDPPVIITGFLPIVQWLESQLVPLSDNLDTIQAGEWKARQDELPARAELYNYWVKRMANYLYLPIHSQPWDNCCGRLIN